MTDGAATVLGRVPEGWATDTLGNLASKIGSGATPRGGASVYSDQGVAFIRSQNVLDHAFSTTGLVFIDDAAAEALRGVTVEPGDVLINITGDSILRCTVVPDSVLPARVSQHVAIIRTRGRLEPVLVQKFLAHPVMKQWMLGLSSGGTRKAITKGHIESFVVPVPPPGEQRAIADVLAALDDKIESNRRRARIALNLSEAILEDSLSRSRSSERLERLAEFHNRRRVPLSAKERSEMPGSVPYYGASGVFGFVDRALFDDLLVLVGEDGSVVNDDGTPVVQYVWGPCWVNNHAHVLTGVGISTDLLYLALRRVDVRPQVTGAVQPKLNMGNLKSVELEVPDGQDRQRVEAEVGPLLSIIRNGDEESATLAELRDALLPELLSGRMRVPVAEDLVKAAT